MIEIVIDNCHCVDDYVAWTDSNRMQMNVFPRDQKRIKALLVEFVYSDVNDNWCFINMKVYLNSFGGGFTYKEYRISGIESKKYAGRLKRLVDGYEVKLWNSIDSRDSKSYEVNGVEI